MRRHDFELWIDINKDEDKNKLPSYNTHTKINLILNPQEFLVIQGAVQKLADKLLEQFAEQYENIRK